MSTLYFEKVPSTKKKAIIFLHGLGATHNFWNREYYQLNKQYSLYFVDLLGFGKSAKPNGIYTLDRHIDAIHAFMNTNVTEDTYVLVGHSLGAIISLAYTNKYPQRIEKSFLLGLPYYHSEKEAHTIIQHVTKYPRWFYTKTVRSQLLYTCAQRLSIPFNNLFVPFFFPNLPPQLIKDMLVHSYTALVTTVGQTIIHQNIPSLLNTYIHNKVYFIHGLWDAIAPIQNIQELTKQNHLPLYAFPGDHNFPLDNSHLTVNLLQKYFL